MRTYKEVKSTARSEEYTKYTITFNGKTKNDETVLLVVERCPDGCMPLWVKRKIFDKPFAWWHISTYVTDKDGYTWGRYNPQEEPEIIKDNKGKVILSHNVIDFDWVLPATEENRQKIIAEVSKRAFKE